MAIPILDVLLILLSLPLWFTGYLLTRYGVYPDLQLFIKDWPKVTLTTDKFDLKNDKKLLATSSIMPIFVILWVFMSQSQITLGVLIMVISLLLMFADIIMFSVLGMYGYSGKAERKLPFWLEGR